MESVTFTADDFGLSLGVNEAVERAHRHGLLDAASLMVAGPAAADAVARAQRNPGLRVGLHAVLVEGPALTQDGWLSSRQTKLGFEYAFARRSLAREIAAQYAAFDATGLKLDHVNAHKHMHLHPVVGNLLIDIGRDHHLRAIRVPSEPPAVLAACGTRASAAARALYAFTGWLRRAATRAHLRVTDHCFGLAWSGHMTAPRLRALAAHLPRGTSEVYLHPAAFRDALLDRLMPAYEHEAELAALLDPAVAAAFATPSSAKGRR